MIVWATNADVRATEPDDCSAAFGPDGFIKQPAASNKRAAARREFLAGRHCTENGEESAGHAKPGDITACCKLHVRVIQNPWGCLLCGDHEDFKSIMSARPVLCDDHGMHCHAVRSLGRRHFTCTSEASVILVPHDESEVSDEKRDCLRPTLQKRFHK